MSAPPFKVKAVYEYNSPHDDDLSFPNGQIITVTEEEDADWYIGEYMGADGAKESGLFPKNFVERYEPETPPRPSRTKSKKDMAPAAAAEAPTENVPTSSSQSADATLPKPVGVPPSVAADEPTQPVSEPVKTVPSPAAKPDIKSSSTAKAPPPTVAEKPSSFKDRIAAFNKTSQAPLAPVKPGGASSAGGFIKKPFVAPPPSRDAYVPQTRAPPAQKIYRREEDPEIAERQAQDQADAEKAGLIQTEGTEEEEDIPKQSLKDRIAMLQKQQIEQAARRAEVSAKEKPKKPLKKRTDSNEYTAKSTDAEGSSLAKVTSGGSGRKSSVDTPSQISSPPPDRGMSRERLSSEISPREVLSDENDADQSGAGDTTEDADGNSTSVEDIDERPRTGNIAQTAMVEEPELIEDHPEGNDEGVDEEDEEDEVDAETRRKIELRDRMAKMSGGMGMAGMFGGGMAMTGVIPRKKKQSSGTSDIAKPTESFDVASAPLPPQRLPMIPTTRDVPPAPTETFDPSLEKEPEPSQPKPFVRETDEASDVEEPEPQYSTNSVDPDRGSAPPIPQGRLQFIQDMMVRCGGRLGNLQQSEDINGFFQRSYVGQDGTSETLLTVQVFKRPLPPAPPLSQRAVPLPPPGDRPVPVPPQSRPVPPQPPAPEQSIEHDELSDHEIQASSKGVSSQPRYIGERAMPVRSGSSIPSAPTVPGRPDANKVQPPQLAEAVSPTPESRATRQVPPIPIGSPQMPPAAEIRPPPPPPPTAAPPSRRSTETSAVPFSSDKGDENDESDYEGDYDTDIASAAPPNHALRAHNRELSVDDGSFSEATSISSPKQMPSALPPPLPSSAHRAPPPPPPHQQPKNGRQSMEAPKAPPPVPTAKETVSSAGDEDYDPYRHTAPTHGIPSNRNTPTIAQESAFSGGFLPSSPPIRLPDRATALPQSPPTAPPHINPVGPAPRQSRDTPRQSLDVPYSQGVTSRRSTDQPRPSAEHGYIAQDIDLGEATQWWAQLNIPPPAIQNRTDVLYEMEESSTSKRGGRTSISKDVYVLFMDYSQSIITARFDSKDTSDVFLEQRHEGPPARLRQDQLEEAHTRFGMRLSEAATARQNSTVGDGSAHALILELIHPFSDALFPVGNRAYGALVYSNMANATQNQYDEIRPGDIISFRNAKFQGKHGAMHQKYSLEVGKPDHVGIVVDWDGTKKKVRAWEQGRDGVKKVKMESFRVGDLRSGEVKVWRVMSRSWVGWEGSN